MISPQAAAQKWSRNLAASSQSIKDGVNAVTTSPTELAAAQQDRYVQGVVNAAQSGKWAAKLRRVSLQDWKQAMLTKGAPRIAQGAAEGTSKMQTFLTNFLPVMQQASEAARALPKGGIENALARVRTVITAAKQFGDNNKS